MSLKDDIRGQIGIKKSLEDDICLDLRHLKCAFKDEEEDLPLSAAEHSLWSPFLNTWMLFCGAVSVEAASKEKSAAIETFSAWLSR